MQKLYSKPVLIIKSICCLLLTPIFLIISSLISTEDPFLYLLAATIPVMLLYALPYWLSVHNIRKYPVTGIGRYIGLDALTLYLPTVSGILIYELADAAINGQTAVSGFTTIVFAVVCILIAGMFWINYKIFSRK